jgi:hypothetical protein
MFRLKLADLLSLALAFAAGSTTRATSSPPSSPARHPRTTLSLGKDKAAHHEMLALNKDCWQRSLEAARTTRSRLRA